MILGLFLICVTLLGVAVAMLVSRPPTPDARLRDYDRRLRRVQRDPELATLRDIENLLLADGVPAGDVTRVLRRAADQRIGARTMWRWADQHGPTRLVAVLDAGLGEDSLLDHLDAGTVPEWHSITVFASLTADRLPADMPLDELVDLDAVPTFDELTFAAALDDWTTHPDDELAGFDALPPIADPGFGPFSAEEARAEAARAAADAPLETGPNDRKEDGGPGWSAVA